VFCANPSRSVHKYGERSQLFSIQNTSIAAAYAQLTVYALGLTTVWTGAFDEKKVSEILGLPEGYRPVAMLPIGYPAKAPKEKTTRGPRDLIHRISWRKSSLTPCILRPVAKIRQPVPWSCPKERVAARAPCAAPLQENFAAGAALPFLLVAAHAGRRKPVFVFQTDADARHYGTQLNC
jgi:nitroreductase family protein